MEGKTGLVNISNCRLNRPQDWSISFAHSHTKKKKGKGWTESSPSMGGLSYSSVVKMTFCLHWRGTDQLRSYSGRGVDFWHSLVAGPSLPAFSIVPDRADATLWYLFIYWSFNLPKMLGLCLYVPVSNSDPIEVEYFESNGLPSELKSLFNKLSVFLPSQEFSAYQRWRKVGNKLTNTVRIT